MIQRIQSLYLLLVLLIGLLVVFFNPNYAVFKDSKGNKSISLGYTKTTIYDATTSVQVSKYINYIFLIAITLGAAIAIFLYKNTPLQKKICIYVSLLSAFFCVIMIMDFKSASGQVADTSAYPGLFSIFPIVFIVCSIMAWMRIRSDEKLIKSMDRIR